MHPFIYFLITKIWIFKGDICKLEKKIGTCRDMLERYYFDSNTGTCQQFMFGGCDGNISN